MFTSDHPRVSVIVPAYDEAAVIDDCLTALVDQTYPDDRYEVVVVDNDSSDGTADIARSYPVTVVSEHETQSSYAARNTGIDHATSEVLAFTDADVTVARDWIESGVAVLAECEPPAAVYGRTTPIVGEAPGLYEKYDTLRSFDTPHYKTWNLFTTASVFEAVGRFCARLVSGGDIEWSERLAASGVTIRRSESVRARHPPRGSWTALWGMSVRQGYGSGQRMRLCYPESTVALLAKEPLRLVTWYLRVARDLSAGTHRVDITTPERLGMVAIAAALGLAMAYGRVRGLVEGAGGGTVGDYG